MLSVLRHRNYGIYFVGQFLSLLGTSVQSLAQAWLVYRLTGSALALGLVSLASQGPLLLLMPLGGALADRVSRRSILLLAQTINACAALLLGVLALRGAASLELIIALAVVTGLVTSMEMPARQSFLVELVAREDLQPTIALNGIMLNFARTGGPLLGGVLVAAIGEGWAFVANGATFVAATAGLLLLRLPPHVRRAHSHPLEDLREGFRYVVTHREIRTLLVMLMMTGLGAAPYIAFMPMVADDLLDADARGYGLLMSSLGVGSLVGALALGRIRSSALSRAPALAAVGFGVAAIGFSFSRELWLSCALVLPTTAALMLQGGATSTIMQLSVDDRMRGRVMAYYSMAFLGMLPVGALLGGLIADALGLAWTIFLGGGVAIVAGGMELQRRRRG